MVFAIETNHRGKSYGTSTSRVDPRDSGSADLARLFNPLLSRGADEDGVGSLNCVDQVVTVREQPKIPNITMMVTVLKTSP